MHKKDAKLVVIAALFLLGGSLLFAQPAHAQAQALATAFFGISDIPTVVLVWIATKITYIIGFVAAVTFSLGGFLIDLALELNSGVARLPIVQTGWTIVLNMTNLAFVLGIIWIAIATIIRSQGYGMKQILWKLIVAAVLVNFSLVISGFFLDFAGLMTEFFVEKASPTLGENTVSFSSQLAASLQPQTALSVDSGSSGLSPQAEFQKKLGLSADLADVTNNASAQFNILINLVFGVLFTVVGAIVFLGIAVMLLVRFLFITILLILAPVVWLGWVFPALGKYWSEWWSNFIKWTFFAPISTFFLYLAINAAISVDRFKESFSIDLSAPQGNFATAQAALKGLLFNSLENVAQQVIVVGLLIGALIAAEKSGIAFAGAFKGAAIGVGKWTGDKAKSMGARAATAPLRSQGAKDFLENASKSKNPFMRLAGMAAIRPIMGAQARERAEIEAKRKEDKNTPKDLRNIRNALDMTSSRKMANMLNDAEKGDFSGVDMDLARQNGYDKEMEKFNPALAEKVRTSAEKVNVATTAEEKTVAIEGFKKELQQKLDSIKPGDQKDIKLEALLRGAGTGIKEDDWEGSDLGKATIDVIVKNVQADGFSRMTKDLSHEKRREVIDKIIGMTKDEAERGDADETRKNKLEEFKGRNESLYKYMKSVGNEIFLGARPEEAGAEKAAEPAPETGKK